MRTAPRGSLTTRLAEARALLAWLARETDAGNLKQVGKIVNHDAGSLSSAVRRLTERARADDSLAIYLDAAKSTLFANLDA